MKRLPPPGRYRLDHAVAITPVVKCVTLESDLWKDLWPRVGFEVGTVNLKVVQERSMGEDME